jgi:hypothetical protein
MMRLIRRGCTRNVVIVTMIGLAATGCGPLTLSYLPTDITRLSGLGSLAVYSFVDARGTDDRRIGTAFFQGQILRRADPVHVSEPVAVAVTRAFADGLSARGFRILDMTGAPFAAGHPRPDTPVALSGEILRLWQESVTTSGVGGTLEYRAECAVLLQAYETASGTRFWDKVYWQGDSTASRALARTVTAALNDPELIERLGARTRGSAEPSGAMPAGLEGQPAHHEPPPERHGF